MEKFLKNFWLFLLLSDARLDPCIFQTLCALFETQISCICRGRKRKAKKRQDSDSSSSDSSSVSSNNESSSDSDSDDGKHRRHKKSKKNKVRRATPVQASQKSFQIFISNFLILINFFRCFIQKKIV